MIKYTEKTLKSFLILIFLFSIISCGNNSKFDEAIAIANNNHENIPVPENVDDLLSLYPSEYSEDQYNEYPLEYDDVSMPKYVTKEEAIQDIELLFNQLRLYYGKYYYLGGDEVFEEAKNNCIKALEEQDDKVLVLKVITILEENLKFVDDGHFSINNSTNYQRRYVTFYDIEQKFTYKDNQYINVDTDLIVSKIEVNGEEENGESIFSQVLEDDGSIHYRVVITMYEEPEVEITYEDGSTAKIVFKSYQYAHQGNETPYNSEYIKDTLVITPGTFYDVNKTTFLDSTGKILSSDFFVLDLRDNRGGDSDIVGTWLQETFGNVATHFFRVTRITPFYPSVDDEMIEFPVAYTIIKITDTFFLTSPKTGLFTQDKKIIVLTNSKTASAAELLVDSLHTYKNVLFVGTNTSGVSSSDAAFPIITKYSRIPITFGMGVKVYDPSYFQEFVGLKPDIYYFGNKDLSELVIDVFK